MADWTTTLQRSVPRQVIIASNGPNINALDMVGTGESAVYPAANRALLFPVLIDTPVTVTQMFVHNGTAVKGKLDLGIYDESYTRLVNKGLTTQAETSTLQLLDITNTPLVPGLYYFAMTSSSTEATFIRGTAAGLRLRAAGVLQKALGSEVELSSTIASPEAAASSYVPLFGASLSDTAVI